MRMRLLWMSAAAALLLTLFYRVCTLNTFDSSWAPATGRLGNQHVVIQHIPRRPPQLDLMPPPPPLPDTSDAMAPAKLPSWLLPNGSALAFNDHAQTTLASLEPRRTTLHFTFGSAVMMDFVKNWLHFVRKAMVGQPLLVGAADAPLLKQCNELRVPAAGIVPELDVWTYERRPKRAELYEMKSEWKYFRHHNSDFLEMGLVKVAFLWELLSIGFNVLISDLDVVWLNGHWQRWMTWTDLANPPVPEAALLGAADVLVTTDELDSQRDAQGKISGYGHLELNTGVVYFRNTKGSLAMVQSWRKAMLAQKGRQDLDENVNDQSLFNQVVRGEELQPSAYASWRASLLAEGVVVPAGAFSNLPPNVRRVHQSPRAFPPCLESPRAFTGVAGRRSCEKVAFTFGTLPIRPFTGGHTWFNQNVQSMDGFEKPQNQPITVHFTFQFGDTGDYPHGKRQRAREAGLWVVDPPEYFTEGIFISLKGQSTTEEDQKAVYKRFPEWSPQRHMFMDAPQRQAVRDLLALATATGGIMVLPKLWCHCDRYWGFLRRCRMPMIQSMGLPFGCPMDSLYDTHRWNLKGVKFREHTFLDNPNVPAEMSENVVTVTVAAAGESQPSPEGEVTRTRVHLPYATPLSAVKAAVLKANPSVRVIQIANADLRRLCRWLGSRQQQDDFNQLTMYILTESSRYCPEEDHGGCTCPQEDHPTRAAAAPLLRCSQGGPTRLSDSHSTLLYSHSTLLFSTLPFSTLLYSTRLSDSHSTLAQPPARLLPILSFMSTLSLARRR